MKTRGRRADIIPYLRKTRSELRTGSRLLRRGVSLSKTFLRNIIKKPRGNG